MSDPLGILTRGRNHRSGVSMRAIGFAATGIPRNEFGELPTKRYRDPALTKLVSMAGSVDRVVLAAYSEIEAMRERGIDISEALVEHVFERWDDRLASKDVSDRVRQLIRRKRTADIAGDQSLWNAASVVYFIQWGDRVKIGYTSDLKKRLKSLTFSPDAVLLAIPGDRAAELAIHHRLAKYRFPRTEWFEMSEEVLDYIDYLRETRREGT